MSRTAQALFELQRLAQGRAGALTDHLLHEVAAHLVAPATAEMKHTPGSRNRDELAYFTKGMK